jgi:glutamine amidotransferase
VRRIRQLSERGGVVIEGVPMSATFALLTSDPNLIACELSRLSGDLALGEAGPANAIGVGWYAGDDVLLDRFPPEQPVTMRQVFPRQESEAGVFHARRLPLGLSLEENTQPFRYRRWLFVHAGEVNAFSDFRARLRASLPDYLQRQLKGETDSEAAFALFLRLLRDVGRTDDSRLEATTVAHLLGKAARMLEQLSAEAGATRTSTLDFIATNGRVLAACRHGELPLYYALLEGSDRCERCGLSRATAASEPLLRAHLRAKTVAVATRLANPGKRWIELRPGRALAVGKDLSVTEVAI